MIRATPTGVVIDVQVIPRAQRSAFAGKRDGRVLIRLSAPPVDGAANAALQQFLADALDRPRRDIQIISGEKSRTKRVAVDGISCDTVGKVIAAAAAWEE